MMQPMIYNKLAGHAPESNLLLIVATIAIVVTTISVAVYMKMKVSAEKRAEEKAADENKQL